MTCKTCDGAGCVSTDLVDHEGTHIEMACPDCKLTPAQLEDVKAFFDGDLWAAVDAQHLGLVQ